VCRPQVENLVPRRHPHSYFTGKGRAVIAQAELKLENFRRTPAIPSGVCYRSRWQTVSGAFAVGRKFLVVALVVSIVGCTLAMSKPGDAQILTRVGHVAANKIGDALPDSSKMAGPVNSLRNNDFLPVSERVKLRMRTDKSMEGANILVIIEGSEVKLRGEVKNASQRIRAVELAQSTSGVEKVTNEIVEPAQ
jgi:hypothetical protein